MKSVEVRFITKPACTTCRKARTALLGMGAQLLARDLDREPLSESELDELVGKRNHLDFLNPRNELYRKRQMKTKPPGRPEALRLMSRNPNLIRRPVVVRGARIVLGYDQQAYQELLK